MRGPRVSLGTNIKALSMRLTYMKHSPILEYSCLKLEPPEQKVSSQQATFGFSSELVCQVSHIHHSPLPGLWNTDVSLSPHLSQNTRPPRKQGNSNTIPALFSASGLHSQTTGEKREGLWERSKPELTERLMCVE